MGSQVDGGIKPRQARPPEPKRTAVNPIRNSVGGDATIAVLVGYALDVARLWRRSPSLRRRRLQKSVGQYTPDQ